MPKITTTEISVKGRRKKYEVWYDSKREQFYVKLPQEVLDVTSGDSDLDPYRQTEREAVTAAAAAIRAYIESKETRRKVIGVYSQETPFNRWSHNGIAINQASVQLSYSVMTEFEVDGEKKFVLEDGRTTHVPSNFIVIEWSEEREEFFRLFHQQLAEASDNLKRFLQECSINPQLCSLGALPALLARSPE